MVRAVADDQGENAEDRIPRRRDDDTVPGNHPNTWVNVMEIIADAAEKQED